METKKSKAIEHFRSGFNCAQSIVCAFTEDVKDPEKILPMISCGFGAGMGRLQETCGAVTGAFMVIGLRNCRSLITNKERKEKTYSMIRGFSEEFKAKNGAIDCKNLLKVDLNTEEGMKYAHENHLFETICEKCIANSAGILEEMFEK
jgi:C_GCAxxG_C_C family probable redox protein